MLRRGGFHHVACLERMVRVYDPQPFAELAPLTPQARNLLALQRDRAAQAPPAVAADAGPLGERFGDYRLAGVNQLSRRAADLGWRYLDHPYYSYDLFLLEPETPRATLVVLRRESHPAFAIGHILEILPLGAEPADVPAFADAYAREHGLALLDAHFMLPRLTAPFWAAGWLSTRNDVEYWLPGLFNPLELRRPPSASVTYWSRCSGARTGRSAMI